MSKLQELIDRLCPEGVEFKTIKQTVGLNRGSRLTKSQLDENAPYEVYHGSKDTPLGNYHQFNAPKHTTIVVNTGGIGGVKFMENDFWCSDGSFWLGQVNYINPKFLYYYLSGFEEYFASKKRIGGVPTIDREVVESFLIPVPPIEVQEEIVKILDRFADYAAELQTELQARKEQYEYYRNLLLTFNPSACGCGTDGEQEIKVTTWGGDSYEITWKTMGEIGKLIRGKRFVRTDIMDQGTPCIHYGDMYTHYGLYASKTPGFLNAEVAKKMRFAEQNDVVIVAAGENKDDLGNALAWLGEEPAAVHDACFIFKSDMYPNFVSHVCCSQNYHKQVRMFANEAKICSVSGADLSKVVIPLPPYELQVKIASILDRFETLVNDLTQGLPAEIAAVKEQYEYYRNRLLTFNRRVATCGDRNKVDH